MAKIAIEKLDVDRKVRFTKRQNLQIIKYCQKRKRDFSDVAREAILKHISYES
jgi:hypothetical protein